VSVAQAHVIAHGESAVTVQARVGHKSAEETLSTYSHSWRDADERTREAVDELLVRGEDSVRTRPAGSGQNRR
jgi:hypothetical protein